MCEMARANDSRCCLDSPNRAFATTRWSLVRAAAGDNNEARQALAALCSTYWYLLYAYVRSRGFQPASAQDMAQAYFTHLLEGERFQAADSERGRFNRQANCSASRTMRFVSVDRQPGPLQPFAQSRAMDPEFASCCRPVASAVLHHGRNQRGLHHRQKPLIQPW